METRIRQTPELTTAAETALSELAGVLRNQALASRHRRALVLAGSPGWTRSAAVTVISGGSGDRTVWLSEREFPGQCLPLSAGAKLLGSELDVLVCDCHSGFDPDGFGAALGALCGGGLLLLLTPDLERWPNLPDPQATRIAVHPFSGAQVAGRFLRRLAGVLTRSEGISLVSESGPTPRPGSSPSEPVTRATGGPDPSAACRTPDQERALAAILATAYGHARRPLVLRSDRGRGKSSALGLAAAELLEKERHSILVTAPRRSAVDSVFEHAARLLSDGQVLANRITHGGALLEFVPPDELCRDRQRADLLLVDEAAGIPAPLLTQMLRAYKRVVFSTTVHGYEGTGHGFEVRFRGHLDRETPGWREIRMEAPIRWAPNDPLERFIARALLLNAAPAPDDRVAQAHPGNCRFERIDRDALCRNEATLSQLFGLLVLAHYQTRPMDLRHLLDGPNVRVYALFHRGRVTGVALVAIEGGFAPDLSRDIFEARRRPRGHLLPQTLCAHAGLQEATRLRYARVIRIAVHPVARGRGLGKLLLRGIIEDARVQGLDLAGSSFGATKDLLDFWERCDFHSVHLGTSRNAASGAHAAVVLHALSPAGVSLQSLASERLARRLPPLLAEPLRNLEPEIAACLLRSSPQNRHQPQPHELSEVEAFAFARRPYEAALPSLVQLVATRIGEALRAGALADSERDVLICKVLQHRAWSETARLLDLTGRAQVIALLRRAAGKLVQR